MKVIDGCAVMGASNGCTMGVMRVSASPLRIIRKRNPFLISAQNAERPRNQTRHSKHQQSHPKKGRRCPLKVVPVPNALPAEEDLNDYERVRLQNITKNKEFMMSLGILGLTPPTTPFEDNATPRKRFSLDSSTSHRKRARRDSDSATPTRRIATRSSGPIPEPPKEEEEQEEGEGTTTFNVVKVVSHFNMAEYFKDKVVDPVKVDGRYHGWVNPDLVAKYGLEGNAADAWEKNGGGTYSHNNPLGNMSVPIGPKPAGWSAIRHLSSKLLHKNPNAYFYRHTEPCVPQHIGDWTEEEHNLFLDTARKYGCGDKWGLFSSYIPHRVGYQCSNYYRQVILPMGLVHDPNYRIDSAGRAIYCGPKH
eukprot:comp6161_c0_seq1/m.1989 comp6161_c0_seq1/g.1989  ORF comp6161_c0_seq1/g.1989 comp6161_c0_seq1/m.1989 type:complete len:363 (-) comp6161_c0_seq1:642-1730(-)